MEFLQDLLAALGGMLNGIPQAILAMGFGFSAFTTSIAFFVGALLTYLFQSPAPLSFQAETIVLVGQQGKNVKERQSIVFWSAIIITIIGLTGAVEGLIQWVGQDIIDGMMAGVGIMLAKIGIDDVRQTPVTATTSLISAIIIYLLTEDLLWCLIGSVVIASVVDYFVNKDKEAQTEMTDVKKFTFHRPTMNGNILRGTLSLTCLAIATNISYGLITGQMTGIEPNPVNVNQYTITQGVANLASSLFGGAPLGGVISATATSVNPVRAGILMMVILGALLLAGFIPKLAKIIPGSSIAGYLFVLGIFVIFPDNALSALSVGNNLPAAMTLIVTAIVDPFVGLVSGSVLKLVMTLFV